jgi:C1A family cysteine protease
MDISKILANHIPVKKEIPSPKDWLFSSILPHLKTEPRKEYTIPEVTAVSNQGQIPSCASNAVCDAFEYVDGTRIDLSRFFVYWNSRRSLKQEGTYIRDNLDAIRVWGVPPESLWPYDVSKVNVRPSDDVWAVAAQHKRMTYYRVQNQQEIIASIDAGWPVVFGIQLDAQFLVRNPIGGYVFRGEVLADARHAMIIVGYRFVGDALHFRVRNSWGPFWGDDGYCWMDSAYMMRDIQDSWAITNFTMVEPLNSIRNVEFAAETLAAFGGLAFGYASTANHTMPWGWAITMAAFQGFAIWRRWWVNQAVSLRVKLF